MLSRGVVPLIFFVTAVTDATLSLPRPPAATITTMCSHPRAAFSADSMTSFTTSVTGIVQRSVYLRQQSLPGSGTVTHKSRAGDEYENELQNELNELGGFDISEQLRAARKEHFNNLNPDPFPNSHPSQHITWERISSDEPSEW